MKRISKASERYSIAFFETAKADGLLDKVAEDFNLLLRLIHENANFQAALTNPLISRQHLEEFLVSLGQALKLEALSIKFLRILARRKRTTLLEDIIGQYSRLVQKHNRQMSVVIQSHSEISEKQIEQVKRVLHERTGQDIVLDVSIDPAILGGIVLHYGPYKLDFSIKSKLTELKHELERLS